MQLCRTSCNTMILIIYISTVMAIVVYGFRLDSEYITPVKKADSVEIYVYKNTEYLLNSRRVTWIEAKLICGTMNASLAVLNDAERAYFFAEVLSESNMDIENMWIGAKRDVPYDANGYEWITGEHLPRTINNTWNAYMDINMIDKPFPLWVNRSLVPLYDLGSNCVAIGHGKTNEPYFLDLQCHLKRPYACERQTTNDYYIREVGAVVCNEKKYHIFHAKQSWYDAAGYCALHGMRLASVESIKCVNKIGKKLLRLRPSIDNAWIGGSGVKNVWTWLSSGKNINDRNDKTYSEDEIEKNWPPYRPNSKRKSEGCLLIDRRVCKQPIFTESLCDRHRSFICMAENSDSILNDEVQRHIEDNDMIIQGQMSWADAHESCRDLNGTLGTVTDNESLTKLLLFMAEADEETVQHIWVSGILKDDNSSLKWYDPTQQTYIPGPNDNNSSVPWCDENISPEYNCLNMDRENHIQGLLYGMPCATLQASICLMDREQDDITSPTTINAYVDEYGDLIEDVTDNVSIDELPITTDALKIDKSDGTTLMDSSKLDRNLNNNDNNMYDLSNDDVKLTKTNNSLPRMITNEEIFNKTHPENMNHDDNVFFIPESDQNDEPDFNKLHFENRSLKTNTTL